MAKNFGKFISGLDNTKPAKKGSLRDRLYTAVKSKADKELSKRSKASNRKSNRKETTG